MTKRTTTPTPVTFTGNINNRSVVVRYDTGDNSRNWPYGPIITLYHISEYSEKEQDKFSYRYMRNENDTLANWRSRDRAGGGVDMTYQTSKCQRCKVRPAVWAVQNIAGEVSVTTLGSHYRGFPVVKVCDECKDTATRTGTAPE